MWPWLLIAMALNVVSGLATTFQTIVPKYVVNIVAAPADELTLHETLRQLGVLAVVYVAVSVVGRMLCWHLAYRVFTRARERMIFVLRERFFSHVNHLCLRFHHHHDSGELFAYLFGSPLIQIQQFMQQFTMFAPVQVFYLFSALAIMVGWDWVMGLIMAALVLGSGALMRSARVRMRAMHREYQETERGVSGRVADLLRGNRDVKLYAIEQTVRDEFIEEADRLRQKVYERDVTGHMQFMKQEALSYLIYGGLCFAGGWRFLGGHIDVGELTVYLTSFHMLQRPLQMLFQMAPLYGGAQASLERINEVLDTASTTPDPVGEVHEPPERGDILISNVTFAYLPDQPVLHEMTLDIPYGQHVALVGPSGGGKTTLTQLLLRFYDPDVGAIHIGGVNIRHCVGAELRRRFAVVPQDPFIFATTIRENLSITAPHAGPEQIEHACRRANAWEFIERMPRGLGTPVGEAGATLSGGQRQRLAIARAMLADACYFIFDEATSALDSVSERLIQQGLNTAIEGRTAVLIAHRLSTIRRCDRVIVIHHGRIEQDGSYDQLAGEPGLFADMLAGQELRQ
jgi:ABC-type multidrug transport system fused ATPase/permease subunit